MPGRLTLPGIYYDGIYKGVCWRGCIIKPALQVYGRIS